MHFNCHNFAEILIILKKMSTKLGVAFEDESIEVEISLAAKLLMQDFQIYLKKPFFSTSIAGSDFIPTNPDTLK